MGNSEVKETNTGIHYNELFKTKEIVYIVKKDGSKEAFNVQKVVDAVGKSAYRALTKFTVEEEKHICNFVVLPDESTAEFYGIVLQH